MYCEEDDLLLGNIPTPAYISREQYISRASEEIDAALSGRYVTPLSLLENGPTRRAYLIVKNICVHIASGRYIMAAAAGGSDTEVHAYGESLLRQGLDALARVASGEFPLDGVEETPGGPTALSGRPAVHAADPVSYVEAFNDTFSRLPGVFDIRRRM